MNTIFALASAQGRAGVSVIRISGPDALRAGAQLCGSLPPPRQTATRIVGDLDGAPIDQALVLTFQGPNSFTGEDVVELQVHGSIAVVRSVLNTLSDCDGLRMADAGEFTRRALENGKLDLPQVEGLADLIDAETEAQRKQALRVLSGDLGQRVDDWRKDLIRAAALLEATIDFVDEEVPVDVTPEVKALLDGVSEQLAREIEGTRVAERVRNGFEVAIVGPPNAGKSTLLNALAGRDAAITSEVAGTTRDVIEVRMDLGGLPVTLLDTAGLRESQDRIEAIGVDRALSRARAADLRVFLTDNQGDLPLERLAGDIVVRPRADQLTDKAGAVSGLTGEGVSELVSKVQNVLQDRSASIGVATHDRHRVAMQRAARDLAAADEVLSRGPEGYDIGAEELRSSIRALESLVGRIDVENLLDEIFSSFCVGK